MINVYGLKNCDTCRKAVKWLEDQGLPFTFLDVRRDGVTAAQVGRWLDAVGADVLVNKRGTTWRGLDDAQKTDLSDQGVVDLIQTHPALMKRPIFEAPDLVLVGFKEPQKTALLALK